MAEPDPGNVISRVQHVTGQMAALQPAAVPMAEAREAVAIVQSDQGDSLAARETARQRADPWTCPVGIAAYGFPVTQEFGCAEGIDFERLRWR